ncbi:MAG: RibD family protein [Clostridia bacterium]|nr:RibD family protein [Clostridia bacterium]
MTRPYILCHMVTSLDGKVTGAFLGSPECAAATEVYYDIHRRLSSDGFICGRVTMEGSFTGGWYPDLTAYEPQEKVDFIPETTAGFYAVAFDTHGRLGWKERSIVDPDGDPGYDGAQIVEVLSEAVDSRYLGYLQEQGIPYIFAGRDSIDVAVALEKLHTRMGIDRLLLEGGSILNGAFLRADAVDELSLVVAPVVAEAADKPLFADSAAAAFSLQSARTEGDVVVTTYKRR